MCGVLREVFGEYREPVGASEHVPRRPVVPRGRARRLASRSRRSASSPTRTSSDRSRPRTAGRGRDLMGHSSPGRRSRSTSPRSSRSARRARPWTGSMPSGTHGAATRSTPRSRPSWAALPIDEVRRRVPASPRRAARVTSPSCPRPAGSSTPTHQDVVLQRDARALRGPRAGPRARSSPPPDVTGSGSPSSLAEAAAELEAVDAHGRDAGRMRRGGGLRRGVGGIAPNSASIRPSRTRRGHARRRGSPRGRTGSRLASSRPLLGPGRRLVERLRRAAATKACARSSDRPAARTETARLAARRPTDRARTTPSARAVVVMAARRPRSAGRRRDGEWRDAGWWATAVRRPGSVAHAAVAAVVCGSGLRPWPFVLGEAELLLELLQRPEADDAHRLLAGLEERDRRDAHDLERLRHARVRVDVDLHDVDRAVVLLGELLHLGRDHLARPAPGRPEVDHDRLVVVEDQSPRRSRRSRA